MSEPKKVMLAMSGGVDSSVAAVLLLQKGCQVCGATMKLFNNADIGISDKGKTCCSLADVEDARSVAYKLGMDHFVFNFSRQFHQDVIQRFVRGYRDGFTPNPCIDCNRYIKFDQLLKRALLMKQDYIATGHYAKVEYDSVSGRYLLKKAMDQKKDQTYVLYAMSQEELSKTLFPLGELLKSQVREIAGKWGFVNAAKPDSQDICFVKDGDYAGFIERESGLKSCRGNFLNQSGAILGQHKGIIHYTVGQRKGLGLSFGQPYYVLAKDREQNTVTLGSRDELAVSGLVAGDINWISVEKLDTPMKVTAKTRYKQREVAAILYPAAERSVSLVFHEKQRGVAPGQAVVFYQNDVVVGGGTILSAIP